MPGPHDRLVKRILSEPKNAAAELACILPAEIAASVDWASLKLENATFVDDELRDRYADLVFTARVADRHSFIFVLIEHQSEPDRFIAFRMLNYMVRIWARVVAAEPPPKHLPPILPVLLAHARSDSASEAAPVVFSELLDAPPELLATLQSHVPDFRLLVDDLNRVGVEGLRQRRLPPIVELTLFLLLLRSRISRNLFTELETFAQSLQALALDRLGLAALVSYILEVREESPDDVRDFFKAQLGDAGVEGFVTGAQQLTEQVRLQSEAKGKAEGKAEGLAAGKAEALLRVVQKRGLRLTETELSTIRTCTDLTTLDLWLDRAIVAVSADDVFGE